MLVGNTFGLCEDEWRWCFLIPCLACEMVRFFVLGCFSVCVGMRGWFFSSWAMVGYVGWDEDEDREACWALCGGAQVKLAINRDVLVVATS
jgi:hypothetical protein